VIRGDISGGVAGAANPLEDPDGNAIRTPNEWA